MEEERKKREKEHGEREGDKKRRLDTPHPQRIWETTRKGVTAILVIIILKLFGAPRKFLLSSPVWEL